MTSLSWMWRHFHEYYVTFMKVTSHSWKWRSIRESVAYISNSEVWSLNDTTGLPYIRPLWLISQKSDTAPLRCKKKDRSAAPVRSGTTTPLLIRNYSEIMMMKAIAFYSSSVQKY